MAAFDPRAPFDPRAYEDEVLKPLRRRLPHLPDDLLSRYAVDLGMDAAQLRERTEAVVRFWTKLAQRAGGTGLVCTHFLREHDELTRSGAADLTDPRWWRRREKARHRQLEPEIADLAALLTAGHGELRVITADQLRAAAAAHGTLADADIERARAAAGLQVVEPTPLPAAAGMRGRFESLTTKLIAAGVDSVPRLLFPELREFGLLRGFTVTPVPPGRSGALIAAAVGERSRELDTLPDSAAVRATREALGILATEAAAGTDLTALTLFHLVARVRERRADGAGPRTLFGLLTRAGLRPADAGRVAVAVLAEAVGRSDPLGSVRELLADGLLLGAQRAAATIPGPDGDAARATVARTRDEVDRLRASAVQDLESGHHERAGERLRAAVALAGDLPGLAAELEQVPAAAAVGVSARADGGGVRVSWCPGTGHTGSTTFRVVRREGRTPVDAEDGAEVPLHADHAAIDGAPPAGRLVHYAVFARAPAGRWSRAAAVAVQVVPPVTDVVVVGGAGVVDGRWHVHPEVATVEVRRSGADGGAAGEPVAVQGDRAFHDTTAADGVGYLYSIVATYPPAGRGAPLRAEPVVVRGATRPEARPVPALTATLLADPPPDSRPDGADANLAVRLAWRQPLGSEIVLRRAARPGPGEYGQLVALAEIDGYGTELDGVRTARGEAATLEVALPPGRWWCVPFTLAPGGGVRGQDAVLDLVHPVRGLRALRFGDDVRVTWSWPAAASAADVGWSGGTRRVTAAQYRAGGGCQLRGVPGATRVDVTAVLLGSGDRESRAPAVSVEVGGRPPQLRYELRRRGNRLVGGLRATVTLSGTETVSGATVVLVASAGSVMPGSPDAGAELLRARVTVEPGVPVVLEAAVPTLRRPYWLRCFLAAPAPALLLDPPVGQLKVP